MFNPSGRALAGVRGAAVESLFLAMFLACSVGILIFLVSVFRKRDTMAPAPQSHDEFLRAMAESPWPQAGADLGLQVQVDEPEVLLCRHVLKGTFQGRLVRVQSFDRKHGGRSGHLSTVRVGVQQGMPELGLSLPSGSSVQKVHGVASVCFQGELFLGDGLLLGRAARPIRKDGPWIELDGRCDPTQLQAWLEQALQVFSWLELAHYAVWVQASRDHDLRLEWERERRVPRLAGLMDGVGVRVSWMKGGGARVVLLARPGQQLSSVALELENVSELKGAVDIEESEDGLVLTLNASDIGQLSSLLTRAFSAF